MCGLVGVFGAVSQHEKHCFKQLMEVGMLRGKDATGIFAVSHASNPIVKTVKKNVQASEFFTRFNNDYQETIAGNPQALVGHHRLATMGANTNGNAHPFTFDNVTGVHNGCIGRSSLDSLPSPSNHEVDSGQLLYSIAKSGVDATLPAVHGDWALIWFDKGVNKFYFIRNDGRPLYYRYSATKRMLWVVSEAEMAAWILSRNNMQLDSEDWQQFEENQLYSLDARQGVLELIKEKEIKGKEYPQYNYSGGGNNVLPFTPPTRTFQTYEEWASRQTNTFGQTTQLTNKARFAYVGSIPVYQFEELRDMSLSSVEELLDRCSLYKTELTNKLSLAYIKLTDNNWSERVTWRDSHRRKLVKEVCDINQLQEESDKLFQYIPILKGQITRKKLLTSLAITKPTNNIEIWSDVEVRIKLNGTGETLDRHHLFTSPAKSEAEWVNNHADLVKSHQEFIDEGSYVSIDDDLGGEISIGWTEKEDVANQQHIETCKRVHAMLDYFVGPKMKLWDKNQKRLVLIEDFNQAVNVKPYGLDWKAPSAIWLAKGLSTKIIYRFIKQAVEWGLNNRYVHPLERAEVMAKLMEPLYQLKKVS